MAPKKRPSASNDPPPPSDASIMLECNRALAALHRGNHTKALKLIKESISRHSSDNISNHGSAILHRALGHIYFNTATLIVDSNTKCKHLNHAAKAARQALAFSKKSIPLALFHAEVLFELAVIRDENKGYQEVIQECERALMIEDPTDPIKDSIFEEDIIRQRTDLLTQESRIEFMTQELKKLIEKCKNVGDGNSQKQDVEKAVNDFPSEPIVSIMSIHEKRKELESKVMASRLLQQKKLATFGSFSQDNTFEERRKYVNPKRIPLDVNRVTQIKSYWKETCTAEIKRGLLRVDIEDLKAHFIKNKLAKDVLKEAIDFAKEQNQWKFCVCCCCGDWFLDSSSNMRHLNSEHMGSLWTELEAIVPEEARDECVLAVKKGIWKPVDIVASLKIVENQSRLDSCDADSYSADDGRDDTQDSHSSGTEDDPKVLINCEIEKFQRWPLCDDGKRTQLLEKIHGALESLLSNRCLAASHDNELMSTTIELMTTRIPFAKIDYYGLDATLLSMCFLEASDLEMFLQFLEQLASSSGLSCLSGKNTLDDEELKGSQEFCCKERIVFSGDFSRLFLDERLLNEELIPTTYQDAIADDGTAVTSAAEIRESDDLPDSDAFINWLLTGPAIGEQLEAWVSLREVGRTLGLELFKILQMEFNWLQKTLKTKRGNDLCCVVLENFKGEFHQEDKKSEQISQHDPQISYECCLSKLQIDLEKNADLRIDAFESVFINSRLKTIAKIWQGQSDCSYVEKRIQLFKGALGKENLILDARILAIKEVMRQTELKLGLVSTYDYRSIMVHLLKSFMQAQLEDIFDKDAKEKSEAATEALLEELALDSQTDMDHGCGNVGKSKFKKKKKNRQKAKNIKETSGSTEHLPFYEDKAEQTHEESYQIPEIDHIYPVSTTDELEQPQQEHSIEERMLAEAVEYQRKFENEAQLKVNLAEENKKMGEAIGEDVKEISVPEVYSENEEGNGSSEQQLLEQFVSSCSIRVGSIPLMGEVNIDLAEENKKMGVATGEDVKDQISTVSDVYSEKEEGNGSSEQQLLEQFLSSSSIRVGGIPLMGEAIDLAEENKKMGEAIGEDVKDQISTVPDVYSENEEAGNGSSEQRLLEQFVSSSSILVGSMPLMMMGYPKSFWSYVKAGNKNVDEEDADDGEDTEQKSHFDVPSSSSSSSSHTNWQRSIETCLDGLQLEMQQLREEQRKSFEELQANLLEALQANFAKFFRPPQ